MCVNVYSWRRDQVGFSVCCFLLPPGWQLLLSTLISVIRFLGQSHPHSFKSVDKLWLSCPCLQMFLYIYIYIYIRLTGCKSSVLCVNLDRCSKDGKAICVLKSGLDKVWFSQNRSWRFEDFIQNKICFPIKRMYETLKLIFLEDKKARKATKKRWRSVSFSV